MAFEVRKIVLKLYRLSLKTAFFLKSCTSRMLYLFASLIEYMKNLPLAKSLAAGNEKAGFLWQHTGNPRQVRQQRQADLQPDRQ